METKDVAVQFKTPHKLFETFYRMGIDNFIVSDEDDTMAEANVTQEQFDELCLMDDVVYASEL